VPVRKPKVLVPEPEVPDPDPEPKLDPAAREKLIRAVFAAGGSIGFFGIDVSVGKEYRSDTDLPTGPITVIRLSTRGGEAAVLALIRAAGALHSLHLRGSGVGDADMQVIGDLGGLRRLNVAATNVTDAGIAHLAGLSLSQLIASDLPITDEAMRIIGRVHSLESLAVHDSKITAAGMRYVEGLSELRYLRFEHAR